MWGYAGKAVTEAGFSKGIGPVWLDKVICRGRETRLDQCHHRSWRKTSCGHHEDAGVICVTGKWPLGVCM